MIKNGFAYATEWKHMQYIQYTYHIVAFVPMTCGQFPFLMVKLLLLSFHCNTAWDKSVFSYFSIFVLEWQSAFHWLIHIHNILRAEDSFMFIANLIFSLFLVHSFIAWCQKAYENSNKHSKNFPINSDYWWIHHLEIIFVLFIHWNML